jgi:hypothetical protein
MVAGRVFATGESYHTAPAAIRRSARIARKQCVIRNFAALRAVW